MMNESLNSNARKGRLSLSIDQTLLDRLEPYKRQINFSAQAEQLLSQLLEKMESRAWAERNAKDLSAHGQVILQNGPAGQEFDRI